MAKKIKKRKGKKADPVNIQIGVRYKLPKGARVTSKVLNEVINQWALKGTTPRGFKIAVVRWRNPKRKTAHARRWKSSNDQDQGGLTAARESLHLRGLVQRAGRSFLSFRSR